MKAKIIKNTGGGPEFKKPKTRLFAIYYVA